MLVLGVVHVRIVEGVDLVGLEVVVLQVLLTLVDVLVVKHFVVLFIRRIRNLVVLGYQSLQRVDHSPGALAALVVHFALSVGELQSFSIQVYLLSEGELFLFLGGVYVV